MRNVLFLLLLLLDCNRNSIRNVPSELLGVNAVERINETSKVTLELICKYDSFLKNTDLDITKVDNELCKMLLMQKDDYLILAQEKCFGDSTNKYWESEFAFGNKGIKSHQLTKTGNEKPDSIKQISFTNTFFSALESYPMDRIAVLKSNENERTKLRIALAEYKFQLSSIKRGKFDCNFRRVLFESYIFLIKFYFSLRKNTYD